MNSEYYSVKSEVHTTYKTDDYSGKRYPSDYDIFTVLSPDGVVIESFSALDYGLEDAEFNAIELRNRLNAQIKPASESAIVEVPDTLTNKKLYAVEGIDGKWHLGRYSTPQNLEAGLADIYVAFHHHNDAVEAATFVTSETNKLYAQLEKAQADLAAAQAIIVDAGKQVETLKAKLGAVEKALKTGIENAEETALHTDSGNVYSQAKGREMALRSVLGVLEYQPTTPDVMSVEWHTRKGAI